MKKINLIAGLVSLILTLTLLVGSIGATLVIRECKISGLSVNAVFMESSSLTGMENCSCTEVCCGTSLTLKFENHCCSVSEEIIRLSIYLKSVQFKINYIAEAVQQDFFQLAEITYQQLPLPIDIHNKHGGGRDISIQNCQFLI